MKAVTALYLAIATVAAIAATVHSLGATGVLMNAQTLYPLQQAPVDPSRSEITFTGKWSYNGLVVLHVSDPDTECVTYQGQQICGNRAADTTYTFRAVFTGGTRSYFQLVSVVNNEGPQSTGIVFDVKVAGYWDKNGEVEINLSYTLTPFNKGPATYAIVSIKNIYTGVVDAQNNYQGYVSMRANAYLVTGGVPRTTPYQMVVVPDTFMQSGVINHSVPRRALSPYASTNPAKFTGPVTVSGSVSSIVLSSDNTSYTGVGTIVTPYNVNPSQPVAALEVSGTFSNIVLGTGNRFTADANIYTPNYGATVNQTGTVKGSFYLVPNYSNLYHIYTMEFADSGGNLHVMDNADVIITF